MKICRKCQEEFSDKVTKCLYCGGPVEIVSLPQDKSFDGSDIKGKSVTKPAGIWKKYKIPVITIIIIGAVVILLTLSQMINVNESPEQPTGINQKKIDAPAPAAENNPVSAPVPVQGSAQGPAPASAPSTSTLSAYNLVNKALILCAKGRCTDPQKAIEYLDEAIKMKPDFVEAFNNRGNAYSDLGQYQRAIEDYNEAIRLKPDYAHPYFNRGLTYSDLGQHQQAINDYNETIRLKSDETNAYYNRGNAYFIQGNKELGCSDAQKACELGNCKLLEEAKSRKNCL